MGTEVEPDTRSGSTDASAFAASPNDFRRSSRRRCAFAVQSWQLGSSHSRASGAPSVVLIPHNVSHSKPGYGTHTGGSACRDPSNGRQ